MTTKEKPTDGSIQYSKFTTDTQGKLNGLVGGVAPMGQRFVPQNQITVDEPLRQTEDPTQIGTDQLYKTVYDKDIGSLSSMRLSDGYVPAWFTSDRARLSILTKNFLEGLEREQLPVDRRQTLDRLDMKVSPQEVQRMRMNAGIFDP